MDGEKFDDLVKRIGSTRLTRLNALRGLFAGAVAALTGVSTASANIAVACKCTDDLSPKQCPKNSGIEYTCKLCDKIVSGSVQVACADGKPKCICQPTGNGKGHGCDLRVNGQIKNFRPGEDVPCRPVKCPSGADENCNDGVACTVDTCGPDGLCVHRPDNSKCDDGVACTVDKCDPVKGCINRPDDSKCDDGITCTVDTCDPKHENADAEGCVHRPNHDKCDDDIACTVDRCDPEKGCVHTPDHDKCDDGITCTVDRCDPEKGCTNRPDDSRCAPRAGCTVKCDPDKDCVYTCQCLAGESPKGCPNPGNQPQYTCKRCPGGNQAGSVQVECNGSTPRCVCNSQNCTINGTTTVPRDTDVTAICPPVNCSTGEPV